jgi:nitroimidazol reductase NimA-like FMN-containing flavoprotein (pyridoxamine 5'-phosphate oxidase superfamily)
MSEFPKTDRNRVRRIPKRGEYDKTTIYQIIDEALICHAGFVQDNQPFVIPTIHARLDDILLLHGAKASRLLKHVQEGNPVCVTITLLDGLVLARSVFHNSMNYRSVVLFGSGRALDTEPEKLRALEALTEHLMPGRWRDARKPNQQELDATTVVAIPIESASAKIRTGPPLDDEEDYQLPIWAGVLPIQQQALTPLNDPRLLDDVALPEYMADYQRKR